MPGPTLSHLRGGSGPPLLLMHGIGCSADFFSPVRRLLERHREVIALDIPGFGGTPTHPGVEPTVAALADDAHAFMQGLGFDRYHVAGNSLGGGIALELAKRGIVDSACGLSPVGFWSDAELAYCRALLRFARGLAKTIDPYVETLTATGPRRTLLAGAFYGRPWRLSPEAAADAFRGLATCPGWEATLDHAIRLRFEGAERIPANCRVTIAWGVRDALLPPIQARRARVVLPQAEHVPLRGCGHLPMSDDPDLVGRTLLHASR